jgi:hypothetical protein
MNTESLVIYDHLPTNLYAKYDETGVDYRIVYEKVMWDDGMLRGCLFPPIFASEQYANEFLQIIATEEHRLLSRIPLAEGNRDATIARFKVICRNFTKEAEAVFDSLSLPQQPSSFENYPRCVVRLRTQDFLGFNQHYVFCDQQIPSTLPVGWLAIYNWLGRPGEEVFYWYRPINCNLNDHRADQEARARTH